MQPSSVDLAGEAGEIRSTVPPCACHTLRLNSRCSSADTRFCSGALSQKVAIPFDIRNDPIYQNLTTAPGFLAAVLYCLKLVSNGGFLAAPVCSSWVWINRFTSGRSAALPLGHVHRGYVASANIQVCRLVILCFIAAARGLIFLVEQPRGSLLEFHPRWQQLVRHMKIWRLTLHMMDYGAPTEKATWIYSNYKDVANLDLFRSGRARHRRKQQSVKLCTHVKGDDGVVRAYGGPDLKSSQTYTPEFGFARASHGRHFLCGPGGSLPHPVSQVCRLLWFRFGLLRIRRF